MLTDLAGNVTEGAGFNNFTLEGGRVFTPDRGVLEGKTRRTAIELCAELGIRELAGLGKVWALNGVAAHQVNMPPLLTFERGRTQVLSLRNDTAFPHPMHLHGFAFRVIARNGRPNPRREWLDTVLLEAKETAELAFVADNPGDWLFHCHILEHMEAGMNAVFRVL